MRLNRIRCHPYLVFGYAKEYLYLVAKKDWNGGILKTSCAVILAYFKKYSAGDEDLTIVSIGGRGSMLTRVINSNFLTHKARVRIKYENGICCTVHGS